MTYVLLLSSLCSQMGMVTFYNTEYTIQETACSKDIEEVTAEKCPPMSCEFAVSPIMCLDTSRALMVALQTCVFLFLYGLNYLLLTTVL